MNQDGDTSEATPDLDLSQRISGADADNTCMVIDMGAYEIDQGDICCPWDLNDDGAIGTSDLLILFAAWNNPPSGPPDFDCDGDVDTQDLLELFANWGACDPICGLSTNPLTIEQEMADACLTMDDWDNYVDVVTDPLSSQADKDRYQCWMEHYVNDCNKCFCLGQSGCPNPDPFN